MRKLIAAINMTIDGFCDHTAGIVDEEIHEYYSSMLRSAGSLIYGRNVFQLMESFWPNLVANPSGNKSLDDFAKAIDNTPKLIYSRTLKSVNWKNSTLKHEVVSEEIEALKRESGNDMYVGSPSMIVELGNRGFIDEYQLCIHPIILGSGRTLFKDISERIDLTLTGTKIFGCGSVVHYYAVKRNV